MGIGYMALWGFRAKCGTGWVGEWIPLNDNVRWPSVQYMGHRVKHFNLRKAVCFWPSLCFDHPLRRSAKQWSTITISLLHIVGIISLYVKLKRERERLSESLEKKQKHTFILLPNWEWEHKPKSLLQFSVGGGINTQRKTGIIFIS